MARTPRSGAPTNRGGRPPVVSPTVAKAAQGASARAAEAEAPRRRTSPAQFIREVQTEGRKITWTTWKETWITSVMVLIMVSLAAIFFFGVDSALSFAVRNLLRLPEILS